LLRVLRAIANLGYTMPRRCALNDGVTGGPSIIRLKYCRSLKITKVA
jgi:hypothetical protein